MFELFFSTATLLLGRIPSYVQGQSHVFLIGDSVDRTIVADWCELQGGFSESSRCDKQPWDETGFRCKSWAGRKEIPVVRNVYNVEPSSHCDFGDYSLAYLHHYGSLPVGPYLHGLGKEQNSSSRILNGITSYISHFGIPDLVLYHSAQWDVQKLYEDQKSHGDYDIPHSALWNLTLKTFERNLNDRLNDILRFFEWQAILNTTQNVPAGKSINLGVRTAVWNKAGGPLLHGMNQVIRKTSRLRNITLWDFDVDVWSSVGWNYSLHSSAVFKDFIHPEFRFTYLAGEKILRRLRSSNFIVRGASTYLLPTPQSWLGSGPLPQHRQRFEIIRVVSEDVTSPSATEKIQYSSDTETDTAFVNVTYGEVTYLVPSFIATMSAVVAPSIISSARKSFGSNKAYFVYDKRGLANSGTSASFSAKSIKSTSNKSHSSDSVQLTLSGPVTSKALLLMRLTLEDALPVTRGSPLLNNVMSGPAPKYDLLERLLSEESFPLNTTEGKLFVRVLGEPPVQAEKTRWELRRAPSLRAALLRCRASFSQIAQGVEPFYLSGIARGPALPDIYREGVLVRVKNTREVYVFRDDAFLSIPWQGFLDQQLERGWDLHEVVVVKNKEDVECLPRLEWTEVAMAA